MTHTQVNTFRTKTLFSAKPDDIRHFLETVAESLKDLEDRRAVPKLLAEVGPLIYDIRQILLKRNPKNRQIELCYAELKGLMQGLEQQIDDKQIGRIFYKEVYELGILLEDFATIVKITAPIIAFWSN